MSLNRAVSDKVDAFAGKLKIPVASKVEPVVIDETKVGEILDKYIAKRLEDLPTDDEKAIGLSEVARDTHNAVAVLVDSGITGVNGNWLAIHLSQAIERFRSTLVIKLPNEDSL